MSSISTYESKLLLSVCNVGRLEAAHLKLLLDQIEADTAETVTYVLLNCMYQLRANGWLGKSEADLIQAAIEVRAVTHNGAISNAVETRAAVRKLKAIWPAATVEGLVTLLCD